MPPVLEHLKKASPYHTGLTLSLRGKFNRGAISYTQSAPDTLFKNYQLYSGASLLLFYQGFNLINEVKPKELNREIESF